MNTDVVAEAVVEQVADDLAEDDPAHRAAEADQPATEPTALRGNMSVGRTITSVDQDCWPKKARLKMTMAQATECE